MGQNLTNWQFEWPNRDTYQFLLLYKKLLLVDGAKCTPCNTINNVAIIVVGCFWMVLVPI
jgi:hypothetical protein